MACCYNLYHKTRFPELSYGIVCMILRLAVLIQYRSDRQTDRQTHRQTHDDGIYRASVASRGKKLLYTILVLLLIYVDYLSHILPNISDFCNVPMFFSYNIRTIYVVMVRYMTGSKM